MGQRELMPFDDKYNRAAGLGASEMWKAYCWDEHLYYSKLGARQGKEYVKPFKGNLATRLGHATEHITLEIGAEISGITLLATDDKTKTHEDHDWVFATVDAMAQTEDGEIATVEAKLVGLGQHLNWGHPNDEYDAIPNKVRAQVATQMAVEGTSLCYVFANICGTDIRSYRLERDYAWEKKLFERAETFWEWVVAEEGFPLGSGDATKRYLARKYEDTSRQMRDDPKAGDVLRQRTAAKEKMNEAELELGLLDNQLRQRIGPDDGIDVPDVGKATFLFDRRGRRTLRIKMYDEVEK